MRLKIRFMKRWMAYLLGAVIFITAVLTKDMTCLAAPQEIGLTTLADTAYFSQDWGGHNLVVVCGEKQWIKPFSELMGQQMRIYMDGEAVSCSFASTEWTDAFLEQINTEMAAPEFVNAAVPEGSCYQLVSGFKEWYLVLIQDKLIHNEVADIYVTLNENTCTVVSREELAALAASMVPGSYILAGTCTTSFKGSSSNRINNITVASSKLNGLVVENGTVVSVSDVFTPRTSANGYKMAGTYMDGKNVEGMGGGICQVSSTAYNALMNAGVTVTMRYPHSSPVHYLPLGLDATISAGSRDLQFRNDYPDPIIMETFVEGKNLTINVYVKADNLNGLSYRLWSEKTSSMSATTYLTTYINGVEAEVREVGRSKYRPLKE